MRTQLRRNTRVRLAALAGAALVAWSTWPGEGRVNAQDASAPPDEAARSLLALRAEEIAALPAGATYAADLGMRR